MAVNFKTCGISRGAHKLVRTLILIIKIYIFFVENTCFFFLVFNIYILATG
jgi:hypothetical protein